MFWLRAADEGARDRLPGQGLWQSGPFPTWFRSPSAPVLEARDPHPPIPAPAGHPPAPRESGSPAPAWAGSGGRGRRRCQPLAMLVMSALPAPEVKGTTANHSPSVLPAGIRQRREAEPRSRPSKSPFARASLAVRGLKQRLLRAGCFSTIIFSRCRLRVPRPAEALKASRCLDPAGL